MSRREVLAVLAVDGEWRASCPYDGGEELASHFDWLERLSAGHEVTARLTEAQLSARGESCYLFLAGPPSELSGQLSRVDRLLVTVCRCRIFHGPQLAPPDPKTWKVGVTTEGDGILRVTYVRRSSILRTKVGRAMGPGKKKRKKPQTVTIF